MSENMRICYFCGKEATTKEHVPPKSMFPPKMKGFPIKVPSCKKHNNEKSGDDEYFRYLVIGQSQLVVNDKRFKPLWHKLIRSVKRKPALTVQLMETRKPVTIRDNGCILKNTVEIDEVRLNDSLEAIAKGIYYFELGQVFNGNVKIYSLGILFTDNSNNEILYSSEQKEVNTKILDNFTEVKFKGSYPIVFKYRYIDGSKGFLLHLKFYDEIDYVVLLQR